MAWVSFYFLDLTSLITGGLVSNINTALTAIGGFLGTAGAVIAILLSFFIGLALIFLFPIHWCIFYRPDDVILLIAVVLPWILCCAITSGIFAHSPRGGINTSLAIGIGYAIIVTILYLIMSFIPFIGLIIDGVVLVALFLGKGLDFRRLLILPISRVSDRKMSERYMNIQAMKKNSP